MGSFAWAVSLFGLQQMTDALSGKRSESGGSSAAEAFDALVRTSIEQCSSAVRETYEVGDKLQRDLVDTMFRLIPAGADGISGLSLPTSLSEFMPGSSSPDQSMPPDSSMGQTSTELDTELGWGPVPPID